MCLQVFCWREINDGKLVEPRFFLSWPNKILSPQFGGKNRWKRNSCINDCTSSSFPIFFFSFLGMELLVFCFFVFFFSLLGCDIGLLFLFSFLFFWIFLFYFIFLVVVCHFFFVLIGYTFFI